MNEMNFISKPITIAIAAILIVLAIFITWTWVGPAPFRMEVTKVTHAHFPGRVVFVTIDGVHISNGKSLASSLEHQFPNRTFFFGDDHRKMWVSNSSIRSLAGYQSIFTGSYIRSCWHNDCPNVNENTLIDSILETGVSPMEVAVFASWDRISRAVESMPRAFRSIAYLPRNHRDSLSNEEAIRFSGIEEAANANRPVWQDSRYDRYTWESAEVFLQHRRPRLLYLSLVDADEFAHANDRSAYEQSLAVFGEKIAQLIRTLSSDEGGADLSFVITTDHGRGDFFFSQHGWWEPTSARIWTLIVPSKKLVEAGIRKRESKRYRQVDIRPTLEFLLGIPGSIESEGTSLVQLSE